MKKIVENIYFSLYREDLKTANKLFQKLYKEDFNVYLCLWDEIGYDPKYYTFWKGTKPVIGLRSNIHKIARPTSMPADNFQTRETIGRNKASIAKVARPQ